MSTTWTTRKSRLGSATHYMLSGAIPVGHYSYNGLRSRNDGAETAYRWMLELPGKDRGGTCATEEMCRQAIEHGFDEWLTKAALRKRDV